MFTAICDEPSKMSFIANMLTWDRSFVAIELRSDRLDGEGVVVERRVLDHGLLGAVAGRVVLAPGVDVHALGMFDTVSLYMYR